MSGGVFNLPNFPIEINFEIGNRIRDKAAKLICHFQGKYLLIFLQLVFKFGFNHRSESLIR